MNDISPLITVITVVFNAANSIEKTIQSVINQTYANIEYIIIDGGSTDGTTNIIQKYQSRINYWHSTRDEGIYDAMNIGVSLSSGTWVNFMNAGDTFYGNTTVEKVCANMDKNTHVIYGDTEVVTKRGHFKSSAQIAKGIATAMPFCHQSVFVKLELLKTNRFNLAYKIVADFEFFARIFSETVYYKKLDMLISSYDDTGFSAQNYILQYKERTEVLFTYGVIGKTEMFATLNIVIPFKKLKFVLVSFARRYNFIAN